MFHSSIYLHVLWISIVADQIWSWLCVECIAATKRAREETWKWTERSRGDKRAQMVQGNKLEEAGSKRSEAKFQAGGIRKAMHSEFWQVLDWYVCVGFASKQSQLGIYGQPFYQLHVCEASSFIPQPNHIDFVEERWVYGNTLFLCW